MPNTKHVVTKTGTVIDANKNSNYKVELDELDEFDEAIIVNAVPAGRLRRGWNKIFMGNKVRLEFSPHDITLGRIVYILKK